MDFRIADTFSDSLAKLTGEEQKAVKTTAFDLQMNPSNPGLKFHRVEQSRDKNFWTVRVNNDIRVIVHKTNASFLLCFVDHHEKAYSWAERRKLETHPKTGAAQLVEVRETVQEITIPRYVEVDQQKPRLFDHVSEDALLGYGVPPEWLEDARNADEDSLLQLADHLPGEAAEALLELATGGHPNVPLPLDAGIDPFAHPDAQRRFRIMGNIEELEQALDFPWEKWTIFLHPAQRQWVEQDYSGPARVSGSAGTGKTIVALHRAVFLARQNPAARIVLATFSDTLANALRAKLLRLTGSQPMLAERLEVHAMNALGEKLYRTQKGSLNLASAELVQQLLDAASLTIGSNKFGQSFLFAEWREVVDAWQLDSWEAYRDVRRLGRKTRLPESQRAILWSIFEIVQQGIATKGLVTHATMFRFLEGALANRKHPVFDFAVIDEAQDINVAQLRFLAALGRGRPDSLFFAGDLGQRIFQQPFSWKSLGVDIRGRSRTLHINYRTSHQIRAQADRLLGPDVSDVDGNTEERSGTVSVFNGPPPLVQVYTSQEAEISAVAQWLKDRLSEGVTPHEMAIFVRSDAEIDRARDAASGAGISFRVLDDGVETSSSQLSISTMHLAKGLEFRAVAVMACDDEVIPLQSRIETVADDNDLEEVYNTERHLLYVACTRARDNLLVTSADMASEFLDDLRM